MLRFCVQLLLAASVVHSSSFSSYPLLSLSNPPAGVECTDDVCKIVTPTTSSSIKAEVVNLESKILKEWKAAGNVELSSDSSATLVTPTVESSTVETIPPITTEDNASVPINTDTAVTTEAESEANLEPSDLESKVNELKKMGFSPADAKTALKQTGYEVSEAAAMLELEEEEKEIILQKVAEIGEEHSYHTS